jgi:hypothetical protein
MPIDRYNLVILPAGGDPTAPRQYLFSASCPGAERLVSPPWSDSRSRAALRSAQIDDVQIEELLRGNAMVLGGRDQRRLRFRRQQLEAMGLTPVVVPEVVPVFTQDVAATADTADTAQA